MTGIRESSRLVVDKVEAMSEPSHRRQTGTVTGAGVIAAGHPLTAQAGADVLRAGGNAIDAAIAAIAMACVCEPVLCSPGGGAFAMVRDGADGSLRLLDAFVHTPRQRAAGLDDGVHEVHADFGTTRQAFRIGAATAAVPGLFAGLRTLASTFGSETVSELVSGAARAARDGIVITPFQHHLAAVVAPILTATRSAGELFTVDGALLPAGATFHNPGLADALEILAVESFATSAVGTAALIQQQRGHLTAADFDTYDVIGRDPLEIALGGGRVHLNPLPAAGGVLIAHTLAQLRSTEPLALAAAIGATGEARREAGGEPSLLASLPLRRRGTTHVSVIDGSGTACSVTTSNGEGNGELVDGFGFMLNNVLGEDDVNPSGDDWPVDTRLASMMCPTIIDHDGTVTALGSGGSSRIRSAISQVVARLCLDGADLRAAVDAPRLHTDHGHLDVEHHDDPEVLQALGKAFADHRVWPSPNMFFGGVHAARRTAEGRLVGVGDARRDGTSITVT